MMILMISNVYLIVLDKKKWSFLKDLELKEYFPIIVLAANF